MLGAHPEGGVEVDVICAAHVLVLFFCTVQSSDTDGSSPVYKAKWDLEQGHQHQATS